jgi:hypothetical protein
MNSINRVMDIDDLRRTIFSYLRKSPQKDCIICNKVLIWDIKVNNFISYYPDNVNYSISIGTKKGDYCIKCWASDGPFSGSFCTIY